MPSSPAAHSTIDEPDPADPADPAHARGWEDVAADLDVDPEVGLGTDEVQQRRARFGRNVLQETSGTSWWRLVWDQVANPVVLLLVVAGVAGAAIGEVVEAAAIGVVIVANTIVGFLTEAQAARSMAALKGMVSTAAEVEREDRRDEIDAADLVPGDVVGIEAGEQVPADLRLVEAEDLQVEEAGLTGESEAVDKDPAPVAADATIGDRTCMLYMGTTAVGGRGRGIVVATGAATEMGRIAELADSAVQSKARGTSPRSPSSPCRSWSASPRRWPA